MSTISEERRFSEGSAEVPRYKSRFQEHLSQAFTTLPDDWPLRPVPPRPAPPTRKTHKHTVSVESFGSVSSTSSMSSIDRLMKFAFQRKKKERISEREFVVMRSGKAFRKEDIKVGPLTSSTNLMHQPDYD
jgi:hypothetical protein